MPTEDIRIGAVFCTSRREYAADPRRWDAYAEERLMKEISFLLQRERSEMIEKDNRVEKRIDLYVASPDVFWRIVREEAEKIAMRFIAR
jgi:hypothetical protein